MEFTFIFLATFFSLVVIAQEPNVWLYGNGRVTYEIAADSIVIEESDVPVCLVLP